MAEERLVHTGQLGMRTDSSSRFVYYHVVLRRSDLAWYADAGHESRVGFASLEGGELTAPPPESANTKHAFYLVIRFPGDGDYLPLIAASAEEFDSWKRVRVL
jgi:hypothetical protein